MIATKNKMIIKRIIDIWKKYFTRKLTFKKAKEELKLIYHISLVQRKARKLIGGKK